MRFRTASEPGDRDAPAGRGREDSRVRTLSRKSPVRPLLIVMAAAVLFSGRGGDAWAQVSAVPAAAWTTTAVREPLALGRGNALYVADWWRFAVRTGGSVAFDGTGAIVAAWPVVDSSVQAIAPDGHGGWFIAGAFTGVGGQPRDGFAHIAAGGTLDPAVGAYGRGRPGPCAGGPR